MKAHQFNGQTFYFTGTRWLDSDYIAVPGKTAELLSKQLKLDISSPEEAARIRRSARSQGQSTVGTLAIQSILDNPRPEYLPVLVGLLRDRGQQRRALELTENAAECKALLVARAACWADLKEWMPAVKEASRAKQLGAGRVADSVLNRVLRETA